MEDVAKLIEAFSEVLWPAIVVLLIFLFRPAVAALIDSARSRKFTLKLGGQELTMEEASNQQRKIITDLQNKVVDLTKLIKEGVQTAQPTSDKNFATKPHIIGPILWVDDEPKKNSYFIQQLSDKGVTVDSALSTSEGLKMFNKKNYSVVVSDMGRNEDGSYKTEAGLELLQGIRKRDNKIPFTIYSDHHAVRQYKDKAIELGATDITSSPMEIFEFLETTVQNIKT